MIEFISQLPTEYQEVEYIQSSGTQYIDTGVIPTVDTGVKVRGHFTSVQDGDNIILGASDQTAFANGKPYSVDPYPDRVYFPFGGFAGDSTDTITITQTKNKQYEYTLNYMDSGKASVDTLQITLPTRTSVTSNALYLFCLNGNGTAGYYSHFALEYLQITQGESVIHDYVPCYRKADNVAGLYDLVTGTFLTNAGSGTFAVGNNSNKRGEWVITAGGIIPIQYALRRRMMWQNDNTYSVVVNLTGDQSGTEGDMHNLYCSATINGVVYDKNGTYNFELERGAAVELKAGSSLIKGEISENGQLVASGKPAKYSLKITANTHIVTYAKLFVSGKIDITTT